MSGIRDCTHRRRRAVFENAGVVLPLAALAKEAVIMTPRNKDSVTAFSRNALFVPAT